MDPEQRFIQSQPTNSRILNRIPLNSQQRSAILAPAQFLNFCTQNRIQPKGLKLRKSMTVNWKFVNVQYRNKIENEWNRALFNCSMRLTAILRRHYIHLYNSSQYSIDYDVYDRCLKIKVSRLSRWTKRTVYTEQLRNLQLYPNRRVKPLRPRFIPTYAQKKIEHY
ncbi:hypothetical protein GJ496_004567 [Pomphorhynchus laevis]|nr:hypothetical protein GJ496_004567 [Pomphorhynchus laevis]